MQGGCPIMAQKLKEILMYTINVPQQCGCFKRSNHEAVQGFEDKDLALIQANEMAKDMNTTFCKKHAFIVREEGNAFTIVMAS
jgi:hypothetical protein